MGIIAAGQITVVDLSDAPVLNTFITASRPTTQTYSKDSGTYKPSYASTPQVLTLKLTKAGSTANIIDSISSLHWFVVDGPIKTEITSKDNTANEYISGTHNEILTTKLDIDINKGSKRYEVMGIWPDPSTGLDVQFGGYIDLLLTQNGATGPQGPQGDTGNGIANTVITYGLSMSDTTEPATWSSEMPTLVKGMYLWTRTVIIYTNGSSTTSYQISYIAKDADATAEIDKAKQELLEKLETVRDESLEAVDEAKQQLVTVRDESLAAAEEAKQGLANVTSELNTAKQDLADSVTAVNTKVDNAKEELTQAKQDLASQAQQLQEQATAQSELTKRVSSVETTANGTKTTVNELTKTVAQNGKDITSVTNRTKTVEDDLANTKTTLTQVQTTANSTSQKTATLETGLNGLTAKFETLKIGSRNYFKNSKSRKYYINDVGTQDVRTFIDDEFWQNDTRFTKDYVRMSFDIAFNPALPSDFTTNVHFSASPWYNCGGITFKGGTTALQHFDLKFDLSGASKSYKTDNIFIRLHNTLPLNTAVSLENFNLYLSAVVEDYTQNEADIESKVAEYKQTADQNYASLQTTVQNLDGTVQHNKTVADQTAQGFTTRIESLETYKDGETTRANQYFESAKTETARQLTAERTAIAKDYVAKSTYTSDVTGIRNDLTATTTTANTIKTNLANYQASNDRAVANLQSNLQTANGNISSLKTKVEAVPGQITSAVSAVEGKIPSGEMNLVEYGRPADGYSPYAGAEYTTHGFYYNGSLKMYIIKNTATSDEKVFGMNRFKVERNTDYTLFFKGFNNGSITNMDVWFLKRVKGSTKDFDSAQQLVVGRKLSVSRAEDISVTFNTGEYDEGYLRFDNNGVRTAGERADLYFGDVSVKKGRSNNGWSPSLAELASSQDLKSTQSELKQTKDGITLLATKTELNNAKNELQSGINTATNKANNNAQTISTHTTQISALNTGLQAKVSQSDFNTLSGRVTTAENNITAKANELSSKITSVEGKIPTEIGAVNLLKNSKSFTGSNITGSGAISSETYQGCAVRYLKVTGEVAIAEFHNCVYPKLGGEYVASFWAKGNGKFRVYFYGNRGYLGVAEGLSSEGNVTTWGDGFITFNLTANWKRYWVKYKLKSEPASAISVGKNLLFRTTPNGSENEVYLAGAQLEEGNIVSGYEPAPEDTATQISSLSSELKQTKDGITLLATKTELNTAKSDLQSGINTATNKANNAQAAANSNAQTISTHTTQISALNTGLQAKVSQTDFNTLSGRVTSAENNITAKANELSSKITSVEGKIPSGEMNLVEYGRPADGYSPYAGAEYTTHGFYYNGSLKMYIIKNTATSDEKVFGMNRFKVERNTEYTLYFKGFNNWLLTSMDVWFLKRVKGSTKDFDSAQILVGGRKLSNERAEEISVTFNTGEYDEGYLRFDNNGVRTAGERADLYFGDVSVKKGRSNNGWSPSLAELASSQDLKNAQSEFKQTTDSIKASVTSLDKSTVKSSSLTINSDGIVMKAGKSTTDVANAIGSYFSVNQNAINLFSDKINVKGNMIVNGAITSDKIASKSINTAHLNGKIITADVISSNAVTADAIKAGAVTTDKMSANSINGDRITAGTLDAAKIKAGSISASQIASGTLTSAQIKAGSIKSINIEASAITSDKIASNSIDASKIVTNGLTANIIKGGVLQSVNGSTNFELNTGKLFYNNNNTGVFRVQNGASTMGLKFSNTSISVGGTNRILSRIILGGDRRETTLDDGKWDKGGFSGLVIETIKGVEPATNEHADALRAISDTIYFTHTYSADSPTGISAHGWKMETYAPNSSYSGNIVLKPYGINSRQSDIVVGDVRLDNGDGSGYWMRATINTLKACFGHILNGGTSSQALNAIRSELNKISGT